MSPQEMIAGLDDALAEAGQIITLRRVVGLPPSPTSYDIVLPAHVRGYAPQELAGGIQQGDSKVILSPSAILAATWPGAGSATDGTDPRMPKVGDKVIIQGRLSAVQAAVPFYAQDILVRIELQVRG